MTAPVCFGVLDHWSFAKTPELIGKPYIKISEASDYLGYSDPAYFSRSFKRWAGQSASEYRDKLCKDHWIWRQMVNDFLELCAFWVVTTFPAKGSLEFVSLPVSWRSLSFFRCHIYRWLKHRMSQKLFSCWRVLPDIETLARIHFECFPSRVWARGRQERGVGPSSQETKGA